MKGINPVMFVPVLALITNTWLGLSLTEGELESAVMVIATIVTAIGFRMSFYKSKKDS